MTFKRTTERWEAFVTCRDVLALRAAGLCRNCEKPLEGRRTAYCSKACDKEFGNNHFWNPVATKRRDGNACVRCGATGVRLEVNHIDPVNGEYRSTTCKNHQENLETLCKPCHVKATAEQRASGLFSKERT